MRIVTIIGARPQFIKHAVVAPVLRARHTEFLIHTGQHYDDEMSALFFRQLGIPDPDVNLGIQCASHAESTGKMMIELERIIARERPDWVLVYGDTNSTMAGALAAAKLGVRIAHVEAGLRSFRRAMPEEINRVVTDHVADLLLCPTDQAMQNLKNEALWERARLTGDVMMDSVVDNAQRAAEHVELPTLFRTFGFSAARDDSFALATVHRAENTDDTKRLGQILLGLSRSPIPVLLPLHPRTKKVIERARALEEFVGERVTIVPPLGYLELLRVAQASKVVLTDSGGLQKEALFLGVRCVTLRDETEWVETVTSGANVLVGANAERIDTEIRRAIEQGPAPQEARAAFGDGQAKEKVVAAIEAFSPTE